MQILIPVLPWMDYYLNHKYIVENLCVEREKEVNTCNGCCHLKKEIKKVIPQSQPLSTEATHISNSVNAHSNDYVLNTLTIDTDKTHDNRVFELSPGIYEFEYKASCFHPPKLIAQYIKV